MQLDRRRLQERRAVMRAKGHWRDKTLLDHLARAVAHRPDRAAVVAMRSEAGEATRLSYRGLDRLSDLVALSLRERGIGRGDVVCFQLSNWWEFPALHLACLKLGAVSNPLMTIFRERELSFVLELAGTKLLVVPVRFRGFDYPAMTANLRDRLPALRHVLAAGGQGEDSFSTLLAP